ncbi:MAG: bifunctional alpha,alpha-trehalose-phosphate synthase (UDP-forming)/trehalose-phosphatase [Chitinophagaceae bacterium]|nr:bifunctional alpha,alpha-trehalose-phosphate synthase (UDP-forming)/trehalose-phosphatase [Chitinophagaceae bacterium]
MSRLIIISNRLPFSIDKVGEDIVVRQSSGGLVSAIKSFFEKERSNLHYTDKIWVGSMDASEEDWRIVTDMQAVQCDFGIEPIFLEKSLYDDFYNGFSNSVLWPLFHYFPSLVEYKKEYFDAYTKVNEEFAHKVRSIYQPGDTIWVHDYQLILLPHLLREELPDVSIGFFLHIPFPSYEIFRLMPSEWKSTILQGVLGADLIGFHTHDYVQHFIQSAKMILEVENQFNFVTYKNRLIRADSFPIGIDYNKFKSAVFDETVVGISTSLEEKFRGKKIIFSVDRLDYAKGLNYRLEGFQLFLEKYPKWREKVVFILNVIPSRDFIPAYIERRKEIEEKVSAINGEFSTLHWQPLIYRYNHLEFQELCALYHVADTALITPLRDGMNLVAKEYIACCIDKGVLILSELTGAANELSEAILVNPTDTEEVAEALNTALTMPLVEQRSRLSYMQQRLKEYDVVKWINEFLDQLNIVKDEQRKTAINVLNADALGNIITQFSKAQKRCILLDYDGTLAPLQRLPSLAIPGAELLELLAELAAVPSNEIVVVSGRDANTLEKWLGHLPVTLVAEHGACIRYKNGNWEEQAALSREWKDQLRPLLQQFVARCPGSFIEEKRSTLAWHYRNTHPDLGFIRSRELRNTLLQLIPNTPLQVIDGNKVIEVRLIGIDKGNTAKSIIKYFNPDFMLCIGDDTTDEDMFRVLKDKAFTIKIGSGATAAQYTLVSQTDVLPLLKKFVSAVKKREYVK